MLIVVKFLTVDTAHRLCFYTVKSSKPSSYPSKPDKISSNALETAEGNDCGLNNSPQAISESFD